MGRPRIERVVRFVAVVLLASLSVAANAVLPPGGTFTDDDSNTHEGNIEAIAAQDITRGCNPPINDRYCPGDAVTRGQMAAFIRRALDIPHTNTDYFTDDHHSAFETDINAVAERGITLGCNPPTNDEYCPNEPVARDQMASFLARGLDLDPIAPPPRTSSVDVRVSPGESIQKVVDANPAGTSFLLESGVHRRQEVKPKRGMTFSGEPGTVMDGEGVTEYAFFAWENTDADNVTIRNLEVRNYAPIPQMAAINNHGRSGWLVENCEVHGSAASGIRVSDNSTIRNCTVHHNERLGLKPSGDNIVVVGNVVHSNNLNRHNDPTYEAGGIKGGGNGLTFRNNHIYDNYGPGIWLDVGAINVLYEGNLIEGNAYAGIHHEISYDAIIRNNTIRNNGHGDNRDWMRGAGIIVLGPNVEVYGNTIKNNKNGIALIQTGRGSGEYGSYDVRNVNVHDNVIINSGENGAVHSSGSTDIFTTNKFQNNEYRYNNTNKQWWRWDNDHGNWKWWQTKGHDTNGTLTTP